MVKSRISYVIDHVISFKIWNFPGQHLNLPQSGCKYVNPLTQAGYPLLQFTAPYPQECGGRRSRHQRQRLSPGLRSRNPNENDPKIIWLGRKFQDHRSYNLHFSVLAPSPCKTVSDVPTIPPFPLVCNVAATSSVIKLSTLVIKRLLVMARALMAMEVRKTVR